jgi:PIN domain nuclease of toxin-antitoxin system
MRLLLDTHILIWAMNEPTRLGEETRSLLRDAENEIFFSAASIWEVAIKAQLGRGFFAASAGDVSSYARASGFAELPVLSAAAERVEALPLHHRDPFDRLLVAQAIHGTLRFLTADAALMRYSELVTLAC